MIERPTTAGRVGREMQRLLSWFIKWWKWLIPLSVLSLLTAAVRFAWLYPDSENYLLLVRFFRGEIPLSATVAPFSYRPLLPLIAALLPLSPEITFASLNALFIVMLSWVLFQICLDFGFSGSASFGASVLCSVSFVVAYYGTAVLVDAGAMLCLSIGLLRARRTKPDLEVCLALTLGMLFKEFAAVGVVACLLLKKRMPFTYVVPAAAYIVVRLVMSPGSQGYLWFFELDNMTVFLVPTLKTLFLTLGPAVALILLAVYDRRANQERFRASFSWMVRVGVPALGILGIGLFMAHFDARFVWPLYPAFAPALAYAISVLTRFLQRLPGLAGVAHVPHETNHTEARLQ